MHELPVIEREPARAHLAPEPPVAGFETPFDRLVRGARELVGAMRRPGAIAPVATGMVPNLPGERQVRLGVRLATIAMMGGMLASLGMNGMWTWRYGITVLTGALAVVAIGAGVLTSSRIARAIMLLQTIGYTIGGIAILHELATRPTPHPVAHLLLGLSMLAFVPGAVMANLTPRARAWHRAQLAARALRRKVTSLAEWRSRG